MVTLCGLSHEQILHEVLIAPRSAIVPLPDTRIVERPGLWQIITPSLTRGGLNEVACSELPEADADTIIDETIAPYTRLDIRFRWTVAPGARTGDIAARLARRGLRRSESHAMARETSGVAFEDDGAVTVEEVRLETLDDFTRVMAEGWSTSALATDALHRRMFADPGRRHRFFIARHGGASAGVASYAALERDEVGKPPLGSAYLIGAVVLPAFRGRGVYRALVGTRLRHAEACGLSLATSIARAETSAPILARLGFERIGSLEVFSNDWSKRISTRGALFG